MRIRVLGGGWYGSHLALSLLRDGHQVELHETGRGLFCGASGANPARLHKGFHYPRSRLTRAACQEHEEAFMAAYGHLTRAVPTNIYAVAAEESMVDFGTYKQVLAGEVEHVTINPSEFGLRHIEGAMLTGERHIVVDEARAHFSRELNSIVKCGRAAGSLDDEKWDATLDCTFCALDAEAVDRYEPCVMGLLSGPTRQAVTIMDGPFPSLYPWNEDAGLSSLTSAKWTPLSKTCRTWMDAWRLLQHTYEGELLERARAMFLQLLYYWPEAERLYELVDVRVSIRAMPKSGADARLVDLVRVGNRAWRIRAGKIDAIFRAEALVKEALGLC